MLSSSLGVLVCCRLQVSDLALDSECCVSDVVGTATGVDVVCDLAS